MLPDDHSVTMIHDDEVKRKSAGSGLTWSMNDHYVSVNFSAASPCWTPPRPRLRAHSACALQRDNEIGGTRESPAAGPGHGAIPASAPASAAGRDRNGWWPVGSSMTSPVF
jgi:hypothetical protein